MDNEEFEGNIGHSKGYFHKPEQRVFDCILRFIRSHPQGCTEYELLTHLEEHCPECFPSRQFCENLTLFQSHFTLFHCLYLLREHLRQGGEELDIHCLNIQIRTYSQDTANFPSLQRHDPLRDYYLNWENYESTDEAKVQEMLQRFDELMQQVERKEWALAVFGLQEPLTYHAIRRKYRYLVKENHPDHGGSPTAFRTIREAADVLFALFQRPTTFPSE